MPFKTKLEYGVQSNELGVKSERRRIPDMEGGGPVGGESSVRNLVVGLLY